MKVKKTKKVPMNGFEPLNFHFDDERNYHYAT